MNFFAEGIITAVQLLIGLDALTYSAIYVTVKASTYAMTVSLLIGIPAGFVLGYCDFFGKRQIRTVVDTLQSLPTVFIGLMVYAFLTHRGPLGHLNLLFTIEGIAIGQTILALPTITALTASVIENSDAQLRTTLMSLGANRRQLLLSTVREVRYGIMAAGVAAYGRVLTEVGISMMVGGNIKWHTRTITTAIALETNKGDFALGIALGIVLLTIAFVVNLSLSFMKKRY
jgi:tungstate transport system permease protein